MTHSKTITKPGSLQPRQTSEAGYSLIEMMIALVVTTVLMMSILNVLEMTSKSGRVLSQVAQMQQSMRFGQLDVVSAVRMAGRGGLDRGSSITSGIAADIRNNVAANTLIAPGDADSPEVVEGTDILTIRGVFEAPLYQLDPLNTTNLVLTGTPINAGEITVNAVSPSGVPMDLQPLKDVTGLPEAILLVGPTGEYAVVELTPNASVFVEASGVITEAKLKFKIIGGTNTAGYSSLNEAGGFPTRLKTVTFVSILEEYRYYIRDDSIPMLSRARLYPGTDNVYDDDDDLFEEDIAKAVVDLQVAAGIDVDSNGRIADDEWLFDASGDDPTAAAWNGTAGDRPPLRYLRVNTLARTERPEREYQSQPITSIEDREYNEVEAAADQDEVEARMYRRRVFQTNVTVRNL